MRRLHLDTRTLAKLLRSFLAREEGESPGIAEADEPLNGAPATAFAPIF
jgi:hypothetical protein